MSVGLVSEGTPASEPEAGTQPPGSRRAHELVDFAEPAVGTVVEAAKGVVGVREVRSEEEDGQAGMARLPGESRVQQAIRGLLHQRRVAVVVLDRALVDVVDAATHLPRLSQGRRVLCAHREGVLRRIDELALRRHRCPGDDLDILAIGDAQAGRKPQVGEGRGREGELSSLDRRLGNVAHEAERVGLAGHGVGGGRVELDLEVPVVAVEARRVEAQALAEPLGAEPKLVGPHFLGIEARILRDRGRTSVEPSALRSLRGRHVDHQVGRPLIVEPDAGQEGDPARRPAHEGLLDLGPVRVPGLLARRVDQVVAEAASRGQPELVRQAVGRLAVRRVAPVEHVVVVRQVGRPMEDLDSEFGPLEVLRSLPEVVKTPHPIELPAERPSDGRELL